MKFSTAFRAQHNLVSDKWSSYLPVYDEVLDGLAKPPKIMEIGVQNGGSLEIWRKIYPDSELILGVDIVPECADQKFEGDVLVEILDASLDKSAQELHSKYGTFDLIIDDGSHRSEEIINAFINLFPLLNDGGKYIIEDLHADYWSEFNGGLGNPSGAQAFLKKLVDLVNFEHWAMPIGPIEIFSPNEKITPEVAKLLTKRVKKIEFLNSLCLISVCERNNDNLLGARIVRGSIAEINPKVTELDGSVYVPNEQLPPKEFILSLRNTGDVLEKMLALEKELGAVYSSFSWRVTSPVRRVLRSLLGR